jgi:cytochrome c5
MRIKAAILGWGGLLLAGQAGAASSLDTARAVVEESCQLCHNDTSLAGNMSLDAFDVSAPEAAAELAEKMVRKLRAGMMPPAGVIRPSEESLEALAVVLETRLDEKAAAHPNPGRRTFQRLNRAEYEGSIRDLLALDIEAGDY